MLAIGRVRGGQLDARLAGHMEEVRLHKGGRLGGLVEVGGWQWRWWWLQVAAWRGVDGVGVGVVRWRLGRRGLFAGLLLLFPGQAKEVLKMRSAVVIG